MRHISEGSSLFLETPIPKIKNPKNLRGDWTNAPSVTFKKGRIRFIRSQLSQLGTGPIVPPISPSKDSDWSGHLPTSGKQYGWEAFFLGAEDF